MKQVIAKKGLIDLADIPAPLCGDNTILVKVIYSCISPGTETGSVEASGKSLLDQTLEQPKRLIKVFDHIKKQGIRKTVELIQAKADSGSVRSLGYSASGIVLNVGKDIRDIQIGERVACSGAGIANHSEYIEVPRNLVVKIPREVDFNVASTVTLGAIAMQGVRRADVRLGENVAVVGLGALGQITVQLLKASGCRVIGIDLDEERIQKALQLGLDQGVNPENADVVKTATSFSDGFGVDSVIIAAATNSKEPLSQAFQMCRKKGKVVLVGVVGMEMDREDMYAKELDFQISTSYGPGRYDEHYEQKGVDYPYAYVRWTENRNMGEYLKLIADKIVNISPLIEKEFSIQDVAAAYKELKTSDSRPLFVLLRYESKQEDKISRRVNISSQREPKTGKINVAVIGAGGFAKGTHLPNLVKLKEYYNIYAIMSKTGLNAKSVAEQFSAAFCTTDYREILDDPKVHAVMICTRHHMHAPMATEAMKAGKSVFVEKPMALSRDELDELVRVIKETNAPFMVGFNRRFSKYAVEMKKHVSSRLNPMIINYQMNAGHIPVNHWVHTEEGGGRIIGEACHVFDLFNYFTDAEVETVSVKRIRPKTRQYSHRDNVVITLKYSDGSICNLTYTALGHKEYPKEFCQIFFDGKIIVTDDYKRIRGFGVNAQKLQTSSPDKGHREELIEFAKFMKGEIEPPIPLWQLIQATETSFVADRISE